MKFLRAAVATLLLSSSTVLAAETPFYGRKLPQNWTIIGSLGDGKNTPACMAARDFPDGSVFSLFTNLSNGSMFMALSEVAWDFEHPQGTRGNLRLNAYKNGRVAGVQLDFLVVDKNTIHVPNLKPQEDWMETIASSDRIQIIMPEGAKNTIMTLPGSRQAMNELALCTLQGHKMAN